MSQLLNLIIIKVPVDSEFAISAAAAAPVCMVVLQLSNVRMIQLTTHSWHDIGFAAPRLLLHLSVGLPHVEDVVLLDQSAADDYEPLDTPTGVAAAAAAMASNFFTGVPAWSAVTMPSCAY
jgi:hypothetical protein